AAVASVATRRPARRYWIAAAAVLAIAAAGAALVARARPVNIAVVRFDNESGNPEMTRFADGLTDLVVAGLSGAADGKYRIIGNAAILRRPRNERDNKTIAASLNAAYVILGQVQRSGAGTRVLAHLIRMPEQTHVSVARFENAAPGQESELANR